MKILREGDREKGLCPACETSRTIRYEYQSVHLEATDVDVDDVLVGSCEVCSETVSIPPQSTPRLREARRSKHHTLEARIPRHLDDVVFLIAADLDIPAAALRGTLLRYYMNELSADPKVARRIGKLAGSELAGGARNARVSLRMDAELRDAAWCAASEVGLSSWADVVRGALVAAKQDFVDGRASVRKGDLRRFAAII